MDTKALESLFAGRLPAALASDLVTQFIQIRQDVATRTLGRSAPGKFIESLVQAMQHLERGAFDKQPNVDDYLKNLESRATTLPDGLKICASRIGRAMYTLRNKRNILHKGEVDPNDFDLRFLLAGTQWITAELVRTFSGSTMQQAGALVEQIEAPVGALTEDMSGRRLVYANLSAKDEILVLLQSHYPTGVKSKSILESLNRRNSAAVKNALRALWREKLIDGPVDEVYRLTAPGLRSAVMIIQNSIV
ncbi:MAG: hypothetical protein HY079_15010 [Elusimicrobia bacterium]|nr:hypothetical protein [Elusimicrobiota bacterium]